MRTAVQETASQIAEKQFQRCRGKGQDGYDFGKGGVHAIKHIYFL